MKKHIKYDSMQAMYMPNYDSWRAAMNLAIDLTNELEAKQLKEKEDKQREKDKEE